MRNAGLIVFQKKPESGKVKTRLAQTIGDEKALEVYQYLLDHTHHVISELDVSISIYFEKEIEPHFLNNNQYQGAVQSRGDLGEKMKIALQETLSQGHQKAVVIGSDCPDLSANLIEEAISSLDSHDLVMGPAEDGGYYLIGLKEMYESLFTQKSWSTSTVLSETLTDAKKMDLKVHLLRELNDVDVYEDFSEALKVRFGV